MGLTQAKLAEVLGMSLSIISKYETGVNEIPKSFEFIFESLEARHIKEIQMPAKAEGRG